MILPGYPTPLIGGKAGIPFVTNWRFPSSATTLQYGDGDRYGWSYRSYITADDTGFASVESTQWQQSYPYADAYTLRGYDFGFTATDIPDGSEITGFEVEMEARTPSILPYSGTTTEQRVSYLFAYVTDVNDRYGARTLTIYGGAPWIGNTSTLSTFADKNSGGITDALCRSADLCIDVRAESRTGSNSSIGYDVALEINYVKLRIYGKTY